MIAVGEVPAIAGVTGVTWLGEKVGDFVAGVKDEQEISDQGLEQLARAQECRVWMVLEPGLV